MRRLLWVLLTVGAVPLLGAQNPSDTTHGAEAQQLRQEFRRRWNERVRQELGLSDDQAVKLQATEGKYMTQRRDLMQRQRAVNDALRGQLQPGVAASDDSVRKLMDQRERNRQALAQLERDADKEIAGYLKPVQQARYQLMRQRLQDQISRIRERRRMGWPGIRGRRPLPP
jgi:Spy/CpxP family protein refolding chaperone